MHVLESFLPLSFALSTSINEIDYYYYYRNPLNKKTRENASSINMTFEIIEALLFNINLKQLLTEFFFIKHISAHKLFSTYKYVQRI